MARFVKRVWYEGSWYDLDKYERVLPTQRVWYLRVGAWLLTLFGTQEALVAMLVSIFLGAIMLVFTKAGVLVPAAAFILHVVAAQIVKRLPEVDEPSTCISPTEDL